MNVKKILSMLVIVVVVFGALNIKPSLEATTVEELEEGELNIIGDGQIDSVFPDRSYTSRTYAQNKRVFTSYEGQGEFVILNESDIKVTDADIIVNGENINFNEWNNEASRVDISKLTNNGDNTLAVENIEPEDATFEIIVPYPKVIEGDSDNELSGDAIKNLEELINSDVDNGFSGAQIVVSQNGEIVYDSSFGYQLKYDEQGNEIDDPVEVNDTTLFDLASLTKMYSTNLALLKLNYEGKLDFYEPISTYIPEYTGGQKDSIRPIDLLNHNAGYGPEVKFFDPDNEQGLYSIDKETTKDMIINDVEFEYDYHEQNVYSDTDYMLLGILIEEITDTDLDVYVEKEIYAPLGLDSTFYTPMDNCDDIDNIAATELMGNTRNGTISFPGVRTEVLRGEVHDEKAYYSMDGVSGHAGLFSNASDLNILSQVMLNGGGYGYVELFDQDTVDQAVKPSDLDINYGMGWDRAGNYNALKWYMSPYASNSAFGHTGWTGTFSVIDPEHNLTITVLTNKKHSPYYETSSGNIAFSGDDYQTGKYGSITSLIYEAMFEGEE